MERNHVSLLDHYYLARLVQEECRSNSLLNELLILEVEEGLVAATGFGSRHRDLAGVSATLGGRSEHLAVCDHQWGLLPLAESVPTVCLSYVPFFQAYCLVFLKIYSLLVINTKYDIQRRLKRIEIDIALVLGNCHECIRARTLDFMVEHVVFLEHFEVLDQLHELAESHALHTLLYFVKSGVAA